MEDTVTLTQDHLAEVTSYESLDSLKDVTPLASSRINSLMLDPFDCHVLEEYRGRFAPPSDADVMALAYTLHKEGQATPISVRTIDKNNVVVTGFTRTAAGRLLRRGFTFTHENGESEFIFDSKFRLQAKIEANLNDEEAERKNLVENTQRSNFTPMDFAFQTRRLKEQGTSTMEIARLFRCSEAQIGVYVQLLTLSDDARKAIADGRLPVSTALEALKLPKAKAKKLLANALAETGEGKNVASAKVRAAVREALAEDGELVKSEKEVKPKSVRRTFAEVRQFFQDRDPDNKLVKQLTEEVVNFMNGGNEARLLKVIAVLDKRMTSATGNLSEG